MFDSGGADDAGLGRWTDICAGPGTRNFFFFFLLCRGWDGQGTAWG